MKPVPTKMRWNTPSTFGSFLIISAVRLMTSSVCCSVVPGGRPMRTREKSRLSGGWNDIDSDENSAIWRMKAPVPAPAIQTLKQRGW